jgi:transcription elongation factor Elf1
MVDSPDTSNEIKDTDIVFDCPYCGKSLAIDYRGAGLTIPCTDCNRNVQVPIPEGMELTDIDSTAEEQEIRILNLRRTLAAADFRIEQLETEVADLNARLQSQERERAENLFQNTAILENAEVIDKALDDMRRALQAITDAAREERE